MGTHLSYIINTIAADGMAAQVAETSTVIVMV